MHSINSTVPSEEQLVHFYVQKKLSVSQISNKLRCSENKINYWINRYGIQKRSIGEALYIRLNPKGDPFRFRKPQASQEWFLFGIGLGLYWGEGTKRNKTSVRLGNTDPRLVRKFLEFLYSIYGAERRKFRFGLQIFGDMPQKTALLYWVNFLNVSRRQFGKVIVTPHRGIGTYREKTKHGVLTVYFSNRKLRDTLLHEIDKLK